MTVFLPDPPAPENVPPFPEFEDRLPSDDAVQPVPGDSTITIRTVDAQNRSFPTDSQARKERPIMAGFLDYFPDAAMAVAEVSWLGDAKHNKDNTSGVVFWNRGKSGDEADAIVRHLLQRGQWDTLEMRDGTKRRVRHSALAAWRAMANLQKEIEADLGLPPSRGSK